MERHKQILSGGKTERISVFTFPPLHHTKQQQKRSSHNHCYQYHQVKKRNRCKTRSRFLRLLLLLFLLSCTWFSPQSKKHFPIKKIPNILYCLLSPTQNNPQKSHKTLQSSEQQMKVPTPPQAQTKKAQNVLEKYEHIHNKSRRCHLCRIFIWKYSNNFSQ